MSERASTVGRNRSSLPVILRIAAAALVILSVALAACGGSSNGSALGAADTLVNQTFVHDMGVVEVLDPDPSTLVESDIHGRAPANSILVVMQQGQSRTQADSVAAQLGGTIVGQIEFMDLYQIRTAGSTAQDLEAAIKTARAASGVKFALADSLVYAEDATLGLTCSPVHDPAYQADQNYIPHQMIGTIEAWGILAAGGISGSLEPVHVGVVDTAIYTRSGHGATPELHFPDAAGVYPEQEVRVRGLEATDTTDQASPRDGLNHGTKVVHVIAADRDDGVTGVAANLEELLTVTCSNKDAPIPLPPGLDPDDPDVSMEELYSVGYFGRSFAQVIKQIRDGADVINLSFGAYYAADEQYGLYWVDFLERMQAAYPRVLFVASAGNNDRPLDGLNHVPGGIPAPNLITVGALDRSGDRAKISDWKWGQSRLRQMYDDLVARAKMPAGWTLEDYIDWLDRANLRMAGSNYAAEGGEVTLAACGTDVLVGRDPNGRPVVGDGTSFAAPQVTAAAAMIRSIDKRLTAADIKKILVQTAATQVTVSGTKVRVPAEVGGRVLRVDRAVLEVINRMRPADDQLIYGDLLELMTIKLSSEPNDFGYLVKASTPRVETAGGVDLMIIVDGDAEIFGEQTHRIYNALESASWTVRPGADPVKVKVHRLDNGACAFLELPGTGGSSTTSTVAASTTTSKAVQGPRWVRVGGPVVNADDVPLEYRGGGSDPAFFPEERFKDLFLIYEVSETSFTIRDRWKDRDYEAWNVTLTCNFDAPPAVLLPGEPYKLTARFTHGGTAIEPTPGARFSYDCPAGGLTNTDVLAYYPWSADFAGKDSKTWTLTTPEVQTGTTLQVRAGLWDAPACNVTWTYKAQ